MKSRRWIVPSTLGSLVLVVAIMALVASRTPGFRLVALIGAIATTAIGIGVAGTVHHFARRLIARRPWGTYLYGVLIGESYLVTILGALTVARMFHVPGLERPGHPDPFEDWQHGPIVAISGVGCGLLWGFLSRHDIPIGSGD